MKKIHKDIGEAKKSLDKKLRSLAGYVEKSRENIDLILERVFKRSEYYDVLLNIESEINALQEEDYVDADYNIIFNQKVADFLKEDNSKANIEDFAQKYDELTKSSPILNEKISVPSSRSSATATKIK